jgi:hypothetical protein
MSNGDGHIGLLGGKGIFGRLLPQDGRQGKESIGALRYCMQLYADFPETFDALFTAALSPLPATSQNLDWLGPAVLDRQGRSWRQS